MAVAIMTALVLATIGWLWWNDFRRRRRWSVLRDVCLRLEGELAAERATVGELRRQLGQVEWRVAPPS